LAVDIFKKYDRGTLPVIDSEGKLLGLVTIDDILDVAEEEATEDIQKIGGVEALDDPYMEAPSVRDRAQARGLAGGAVSRRDAHGVGDGFLPA
jgi:Mg/Co/Ni transporter MgtE